jgi:hypothetical protein
MIQNQIKSEDISWFPDNSESEGGEVKKMI